MSIERLAGETDAAYILRLQAVAAAATKPKDLKFKIGEKGGLSVYGLGRFPVTLYFEQWMRLLDAADTIREFLTANKANLKLKEN